MTHDELKNRARQSIDDRIREGIKALLEQVMEEELTEQLQGLSSRLAFEADALGACGGGSSDCPV